MTKTQIEELILELKLKRTNYQFPGPFDYERRQQITEKIQILEEELKRISLALNPHSAGQ